MARVNRDYAPPTGRLERKVKLNTRRALNRKKVKDAKEAAAERKAEQALRRIPRKWRKHEEQLVKMTEGVTSWS